MSVQEEPTPTHVVVPYYNNKEVGRTARDILYSIRRYLIAAVAAVVLFVLRNIGIHVPDYLYIIVPAALVGFFIGLLRGLMETPLLPPPTIIIKPTSPNTARVWRVYDPSIVIIEDEEAAPIGSTYGATIRLADAVLERAGKLYVTPSPLHRILTQNPLEALAHVGSLSKLAEELDGAIRRYIELYVSTKTTARQLARRRISDLLVLEKQAERAARELIKSSIEEKKEEKKKDKKK